MNVRKALTYVQEFGDALSKARAAVLVEGTPPPPEILARLEELQSADGGWPAGLELGQPESVAATIEVLFALQDLGLKMHPAAQRGLEFLLAQQEEDGGWSALAHPRHGKEYLVGPASFPPRSGEGDEQTTRLYLTALITSLLVAYNRARGSAATRALDFLLKFQLEGGLFPGFPRHTAWYALPILAANLGQRSGPAQNIVNTLSMEIGQPGWFPSMFAAMLRNLLVAGYGMDTMLVRVIWEQLLIRQQEDGTWASEEGEEGTVRSTLEVLWCWKQVTEKQGSSAQPSAFNHPNQNYLLNADR